MGTSEVPRHISLGISGTFGYCMYIKGTPGTI